MAYQKPKATRLTTPIFEAQFAYLNTPNTKHDKDGTYQVTGLFDPKNPEHRKFLAALNKLHKENVAEARKHFKPTKKQPDMKITPPMHAEDGGLVKVNFKESAFIVPEKGPNAGKKVDLKPLAVDSLGQPMDPSVEIWSGSKIRVGVDAAPFYNGSLGAGVSMRLKAVQVVELRTRGAFQFDAVEGGFTNGDAALGAAASTTDDDELDDLELDLDTSESAAESSDDEAEQGDAPPPTDDDFDF